VDRFHVEVPARCPVCHKTQEACSKREMEVVNEIDRLKRLEAGLSIELASCKGEEWMESCRRTGRSRDAHDERKKISRIKKQLRDTRKKLKYYAERPACRRT
jgi:vacuolar-type H+-ATPase subunit I/STV1